MNEQIEKYINIESLEKASKVFGIEGPFDHAIIENFFIDEIAFNLESEFPDYGDSCWHSYDNKMENKKTCNNWNVFPSKSYRAFSMLNSIQFVNFLSNKFFNDKPLFSDPGLNGGGWHIHKRGGLLNPHLDYSIHPKLHFQRKINIIIYLSNGWKDNWGGGLGLWSSDENNNPKEIVKRIEPLFNRAIIFDTTQNSWHGLPDPITCPEHQSRKSMAVYYLCDPPKDVDSRGKALFAPTEKQKDDKGILELIEQRASINSAHKMYKR